MTHTATYLHPATAAAIKKKMDSKTAAAPPKTGAVQINSQQQKKSAFSWCSIL